MPNNFIPPSDAVVLNDNASFVPPSDAVQVKKKESTSRDTGLSSKPQGIGSSSVTRSKKEQKPSGSSVSGKPEGLYSFPGNELAVYKKQGKDWYVDPKRNGDFKLIQGTNVDKRVSNLEKSSKKLFDADYEKSLTWKPEVVPEIQKAKKAATVDQKQAQDLFKESFKVMKDDDPIVIEKNKIDKISDDVSKYVDKSEEQSVEELVNKFSGTKYDVFDFEETGLGNMLKITNKKTLQDIVIDLDGTENEKEILKSFIKSNLEFREYNDLVEKRRLLEDELKSPVGRLGYEIEKDISETDSKIKEQEFFRKGYALQSRYNSLAMYGKKNTQDINEDAQKNVTRFISNSVVLKEDLKKQKESENELKDLYSSGQITKEKYDEIINDDAYKLQKSEINNRYNDLIEESKSISENKDVMEKIIAEASIPKELRGDMASNVISSFATGFVSLPKLLLEIDELTNEPTYDISGKRIYDKSVDRKDAWQDILPGILSDEYTKSAKLSDVEKVLAGIAESIGAAASLPVGGAAKSVASSSFWKQSGVEIMKQLGKKAVLNPQQLGLFANSYLNFKDQINSDPETANIDEADKILLSGAYGYVSSKLESLGMSKWFSKSPAGTKVTSYIMGKVFKDLPKDATEEMIDKAVKSNVSALITKGVISLSAKGNAEASTEAIQELGDVGIKYAYNIMKGEEVFKNPSFPEIVDRMSESYKLGLIGGTMMSATTQAISTVKEVRTANQINTLERMIKDPNVKSVFENDLKTKVFNNQITVKEANEQVKELNSSLGLLKEIPDNIVDKTESFKLLAEKQRLEKEIAGKDENLVATQKARVVEINNELKNISENATKESNVQEVTAEGGVSEYQGAGKGQQEVGVGEGIQRDTTVDETNLGDSNIPGQVQEEVTAQKVVIDKPIIATNTATEVQRVKSLTQDAEDGATLNLDGTKYEGVGLVVPVDSINTTIEELTPEMIADFVEERQEMIGDAGVVKAGIYKFPNSNQVSIDLNVVVPETSREQALEFGKLAGQESLFDLGTFENVKTGATGENPMKFTPEQHREIATALKEGRLPNVFGPTIEQEVEAIGQLLSGTDQEIDQKASTIVNKKISKAVARAAKAVSKVIPGAKFIVHDTDESYREATKEKGMSQSSNGEFNPKTNTIHINGTKANNRTVAHEVFHAILLNKVKTDANAAATTKRMVQAIASKIDDNPELKKKLEDFISNYEENIQNEEKVAELVGMLSENYNSFTTNIKDIIYRWIDKLAKIFNLDPFNRNETYDMLNTIARKVAKGKVIKEVDIKIFKGGENVKSPSEGLTTRKQYGNNKVKVEVRYFEQEKMDELIKKGLVKEVDNLSEFNGQRVVTTSPDDMLVGSIYVNGKEVATGNGGIFFVTKFGDVWANSNETVTKNLASAINESSKANGGKAYLVLVKGSDAKLVSSPQGVTSSLAVTESMLDAGLFSLSDFRAAIRLAVKDAGGNISLSQNGSAKTLKNELDSFFSDVTASTFEKRGNVLRSIIANLAKSDSTKENKAEIIKFLNGDITKGLGVGVTVNSQSLVDLIANVSAEELTKGLNVGDIYGVIEIDGEVKVFQDKHQSYPYHIKMVDKNGKALSKKPVLILPKNRKNGKEILTSIDGQTFEDLGSGFSGKVGATANLPYGKGIMQDGANRKQQANTVDSQSLAVENMLRKQKPVAGNKLFNEPLPQATVIANRYAKSIGIKLEDVNVVSSLDEYKSKAISNEFEKMKDDPTDPKVSAAYEKMAEETIAQYKEIIKDGYFVEINNQEPYSSSEDMISDLNKNKRFKVFSTESGFGDTPITEEQRKVNPLLKDSGFKDINGIPLLVNDVFRFVHDFFGHAKIGNSFGPIGEENAWKIHSVMYSPLARKAMTSETRGQNSFVNFSGVNEEAFKLRDKARELRKNGNIEEANKLVGEVYDMMKFADQKIGLMPDWVSEIDPENKEQLDLEAKAIEDSMEPRKQKPNTINDIVRITKDKGFSDAAIREYLKQQGYTDKQATAAINEYNINKEDIYVAKEGGVPTTISNFVRYWRKRLLSARAFLPRSIFKAKENKEASVARNLNIVTQVVKDFNRLYARYKGDKKELLNNFDAYIRGDKDVELPDDFLVVANSMRNQIDLLSNELISIGAVDEYMAQTIKNNLGQYLTRSYELFDNKNWKGKVKEEVIQKAKNLLRSQYRAMAEEQAAKEDMDVEDVLDTLVDNEIDEMLTSEGMNDFMSGSKLGAKNLSVLKERKDIPIEIRMLFGEYTDPGQNYARTVLKLSALAANHKFLTEIKKNGMGVYFFEKNDPRRPKDFNTKIATEGSKTMEPLNGLYTTEEMAKGFMSVPSQMNDYLKLFMKFQSSVRWAKTIGSVATHIKNVIGNLGFVWINGHFSLKEIARSYSIVKNDFSNGTNQQKRDKMNEYISLGIVKQSAGLGEIMDMFKDADWDTAMASRLSDEKLSLFEKSKKFFLQKKKKIEDAYQAEDDFFKIIAYEVELSRYSEALFNKPKLELTAEELNEVNDVVVEIVKNTYPTYDRIPEAIKMIRRAPLVGNFVSFQAESYRTAFNTIALAKSEISSKNPKIQAIGAKRITGATTYLSAKSAILTYFSNAAGVGLTGLVGYLFDDEDEDKKDKDIRMFVAPWSKNSDLLMMDAEPGKLKYIDFTSSDPHGALKKVMNSFFLGDSLTDSFSSSLLEVFTPFLGEDMVVEAVLGLKNNQDKYGNPIFNTEESLDDQILKISAYMYKLVEPGTVSSIRRGAAAESKSEELLANITGYRIYDVDINKQFGYSIKEYSDKIADAKKIYNSAYYNEEATEAEKTKAYNEANKAVKRLYLEVAGLYNSAERLGSIPEELKTTMKDFGNMSGQTITEIQSGKIEPLKKKDEEESGKGSGRAGARSSGRAGARSSSRGR